jgi:hypothetical protein
MPRGGGLEWKPTQDVGRFKTREQAEQAIKSFGMFQHFRFEIREIESKSEPEPAHAVQTTRSGQSRGASHVHSLETDQCKDCKDH